MKEGIDRQGMHTFWRNCFQIKEKERKKKGGVSMLQAPVPQECKFELFLLKCFKLTSLLKLK
jgi:hypothetical protein